MKRSILIVCSAMLMASLLGACQRQDVGMVAGGVAGAAAGNVLTNGSAIGTGVGAIGGAYAGRVLSQ
jgi:hypothetical protein